MFYPLNSLFFDLLLKFVHFLTKGNIVGMYAYR